MAGRKRKVEPYVEREPTAEEILQLQQEAQASKELTLKLLDPSTSDQEFLTLFGSDRAFTLIDTCMIKTAAQELRFPKKKPGPATSMLGEQWLNISKRLAKIYDAR